MNTKIIICLCGGLGNQFFQYATAYAVAKKNNYTLLIDSSAYYGCMWQEICGYQLASIIPNLEEIKHPFYCKLLELSKPIRWPAILIKITHHKLRKKYLEKIEFCYDPLINNIKPNTYIYGYFQSYKYFDHYSTEIINIFTKLTLSQSALNITFNIKQTKVSVAVHYRDYTDSRAGGEAECFQLNLLNANYYRQAIEIINKKYKNTKFYVFSNKISTAKKVLAKIENLEFIEYVYDNTWEDMKLMSLCNHNIIANSSYSWWSAYLNANKNKTVIAPKYWGTMLKGKEKFNDLLPADWIII